MTRAAGGLALSITAALGVLAQGTADACECIVESPPALSRAAARAHAKEMLHSKRVIVFGRVASVTPAPPASLLRDDSERVATVEVLREWKGPGENAYQVGTSAVVQGYPFE